MPIKVSFILPCYKVAPYVGRCIESIEHQDIPQEEYEIICVDDCSPDNTGDVVRQYQQQYANIVYHRHSVNKTSGGARNTGIDLARGEYIWFVDPDDTIEPNVLRTLVERADVLQTDMLSFNTTTISENGLTHCSDNMHWIDEVLTGQQFILKFHKGESLYALTTVYKSLYRTKYLHENDIRFPQIKSSQDVVFVWKSILLTKRISSVNLRCYRYIRRGNSMTGSNGKKKANAILSASVLYPNQLQDILENFFFDDDSLKETLRKDIKGSVNGDSRILLVVSNAELRLFYKALQEHRGSIDRLKGYMNRKTKNILNYYLPYFIWWLVVKGYKMYKMAK